MSNVGVKKLAIDDHWATRRKKKIHRRPHSLKMLEQLNLSNLKSRRAKYVFKKKYISLINNLTFLLFSAMVAGGGDRMQSRRG